MSQSEQEMHADEDGRAFNQYLNDLTVERARIATWFVVLLLVPLVVVGLYFSRSGLDLSSPELLATLLVVGIFLSGYGVTYTAFFKANSYVINLSTVCCIIFSIMMIGVLSPGGGLPADVETMYAHLMAIVLFLMVLTLFYPLKFGHTCFILATFLIFYIQRIYTADHLDNGQRLAAVAWFLLFLFFFLFESFHANRLRALNFFGQRALAREKAKSEELIDNMIPRQIAERLKMSSQTIADNIGEASVLFADLVGFTQLSSRMLPSKLVEIVDEVFTRFDHVIESHGLEKIKTVGDSYMAVAGAPAALKDHATAAARAALDMRAALYQFNEDMKENLDIRIGIHSGPLVGGVIGKKKMTYDVWGDTVNTASRMESHSEKGRIQISEQSYHLLKRKFECESRGVIEVKGKGPMTTWFLNQVSDQGY